ncbi:alpha/beta fold hydrolase [Paracoccus rhizosphaerae]|uniref:Alpha/beta fold hydrolase n=1 Tax=Paracoccus rhizosphaerae TaxID=1133347 RepID=A0ABV6CDP1_9RHOB|nr:alpha/beta hydrolase [Paracoccus rhizosphaerae]
MAYVTTNDEVELYYEDSGRGPVIAFVSGYMGVADIWHNQTAALSDKYRCITHDNRGYGRSGKPEAADGYSVELHAEDLKDVLDAAGVREPVVLVTHSMGGNISTEFALRYPARVAGIIYTGTYLSGAQFRRMGVTGDRLFEGVSTLSASVRFFTAFGLAPKIALEAAKWARPCLHGNAQALSSYDCEHRYKEIEFPVLIVQGGSDVITPADPCATELQVAIGGARLEILEGVNHFPQTEAPERVSELIDTFVCNIFSTR